MSSNKYTFGFIFRHFNRRDSVPGLYYWENLLTRGSTSGHGHSPAGRTEHQAGGKAEMSKVGRSWRLADQQLGVSEEVSRAQGGRKTTQIPPEEKQQETREGRLDRLTSPRNPGCCFFAPGLRRWTTRRTPTSDTEHYRKHIGASHPHAQPPPPPARFFFFFF